MPVKTVFVTTNKEEQGQHAGRGWSDGCRPGSWRNMVLSPIAGRGREESSLDLGTSQAYCQLALWCPRGKHNAVALNSCVCGSLFQQAQNIVHGSAHRGSLRTTVCSSWAGHWEGEVLVPVSLHRGSEHTWRWTTAIQWSVNRGGKTSLFINNASVRQAASDACFRRKNIYAK